MKDWDDLRFFLAVARKGSIRGAASDLGVNHSTVSRRIDAFEKKLDVRVFERLPSGYFLTQAGEEMLRSAERVQTEVTAAERRVAGRDARLSGLLRVTLPDSLAQSLLMPDLVAFCDAHPDIDLELIASSAMADLARRDADVAIRLSNDPPGYLVGRRLLKYATAIYASTAYLARHDPIANADELRWIGWSDTVSDPQWVRESPFPRAPARNRIASTMVQLAAAKSGMGLAMLPCYLGDTEPTLRRTLPHRPVPDRDVWLLTHEDLRHTARVRRFLDFIADAILAKRDLMEGRSPAMS